MSRPESKRRLSIALAAALSAASLFPVFFQESARPVFGAVADDRDNNASGAEVSPTPAAGPPTQTRGQTMTRKEPDVAVKAVRAGNEERAPVRVAEFREVISVETVRAPRGSSVASLLAERKIRPDAYSFGMVMDLNPNLADITNIEEGQELLVPTVNTAALNMSEARAVRFDLAAGYSLHLSLQAAIENSLKPAVLEMKAAASRESWDASRTGFLSEAEQNLNLLQEIRQLPINQETLKSIASEAETFNAAVELVRREGRVDQDILDVMRWTGESWKAVAADARQGRNRKTLKVLAQILGVETPPPFNIRVHCRKSGPFKLDARKNLDPYRSSEPFSGLTGMSSADLEPEVRYFFWLVREDNGQRISNAVMQKVERSTANCPPRANSQYDYCLQLQPTTVN